MSRNENFDHGLGKRRTFSPYAPLFHGSEQDFSPGDVIEPRSKDYAHATTGLHTARVFGSKVYEVEPVDPNSVWDRKMKHTGGETHYERLSESGYRVKGVVPKSRKPSYYREQSAQAYERWAQETGASYCQNCSEAHEPDQHR